MTHARAPRTLQTPTPFPPSIPSGGAIEPEEMSELDGLGNVPGNEVRPDAEHPEFGRRVVVCRNRGYHTGLPKLAVEPAAPSQAEDCSRNIQGRSILVQGWNRPPAQCEFCVRDVSAQRPGAHLTPARLVRRGIYRSKGDWPAAVGSSSQLECLIGVK